MDLIALDLDGTLEDSRADMVAAAQRVRAALGLAPRTADALRPHVNAGMDALYRACFDDYLSRVPEHGVAMLRVREAYEADYLAHVAVETRLYPGIAEVLPELAERGKLACVTNKPERISRRLLEALAVARHFETVVGGDSCAHEKPHPVMLETAARRCGFDPARGTAFMVGDSAGDLRLGRAYGARCVLCAWGYAPQAFAGADFVAREPRDLLRAFELGTPV